MTLRVPEMCFWPAKTRKNFEFFEMHTCFWPGTQLWFWHKWRKLFTSSLLFHSIDEYSCLRCWNEFFLSCVSYFRLNFSRIALWRKRMRLDSKSDLTTNDWFWFFFVGKWLLSLTSYLYRLKSARIVHLLIVFDDIIFFQYFVWGVFWSVL